MDSICNRLSLLTDIELEALDLSIEAMQPGPAPNLLEWLRIAVDREQHRRIGLELPDLPINEAIPPEESIVAMATATALRGTAKNDNVRALFHALCGELSEGPQH